MKSIEVYLEKEDMEPTTSRACESIIGVLKSSEAKRFRMRRISDVYHIEEVEEEFLPGIVHDIRNQGYRAEITDNRDE